MIYNKIFSYLNNTLIKYNDIKRYKKISHKTKNNPKYLIKNNPLISIYIPTFNRKKLLEIRSIPSVLNQTYKNFELLVIGDRCNDDSEKFIKSIKDPRIVFKNIHYKKKPFPETKENLWLAGEVLAANHALDLCKGEWIARLDDDDVFTNDHLEKLLNFANSKNFEFVSGTSVSKINNRDVIHNPPFLHSDYFKNTKYKIINNNVQLGAHSTWLYKNYLKNFKYNINCWRKDWNRVNDVDLAQRLFISGVKMGYLNEPVLIQNPRPGNINVGFKAL